jgi:adenylyl-sulfate kinase
MKNNKKGLVLWLTGLPCSGKTSIAKELEKYFKGNNIPVQRLDGDIVRGTINSDLGFSKKDRDENIRRVTHIAKMLSDNSVNVVVAFVSPYQKMRDFARDICGENFVEVHIDCSIEECKRRDVKGMYAKALAGEIKDFTGVQDPYEIPENPEIKVDTEKKSLDESVGEILEYLKNFEK